MSIHMDNPSLEAAVVKPTQSDCVHWWILDNRSLGRCKKCSAVKDFVKLEQEQKEHHSKGNKKDKSVINSGKSDLP